MDPDRYSALKYWIRRSVSNEYGSKTLVIIEAFISAKLQNKMRCKAWRSSREWNTQRGRFLGGRRQFRFCMSFSWRTPPPPSLKRQCHKMDIFWGSRRFNQYFLGVRRLFPRSFNSFSSCYTNINCYLLASMKFLNNFEISHWNSPQNYLHCVIGRYFLASTPHWLPWKCAKRFRYEFTGITGGFLHFQGQYHRRWGFWKGLLKEFSKLVCNFIEVSKNLYFYFSNNKAPKNFLNHHGIYEGTEL